MLRTVFDWLDERLGLRQITGAALDEEIRGGARWAYVFGSAVLFVFLTQALTGIFMAMYYVPSSDHAHISVAYIQKVVPAGSIVRGLHYYGATLFIILIVCHMSQTFFFGAYKRKRELNWLVGGALLLIALGFGFTGYLLPWDQEAYFGTKVGTSIAGEIPVVGPYQQHLMLGGTEITSLTLSRFFMVHAFLLPLCLVGLIGLHLFLFRKAGPAGPYHDKDDSKIERFYPKQLLMDMVVILVVFAVLLLLARFIPADLGPEADPTSDYLARPAWYFLPLFELLKYFPGRWSLIPTAIFPLVLFGLIFAVPFLDRRAERSPLKRPIASVAFCFVLVGAVGLGVISRIQDRNNPEFNAKLQKQKEESENFLKSSFAPQDNGRLIPVTPPTVANPAEDGSPALRIYLANCSSCHGATGDGGPLGPSLVNISRRRHLTAEYLTNWIAGHNRELAAGSMPKFQQLDQTQRSELADFITKLDKPLELVEASHGAEAAGNPPGPAAPPKAYADNCAMCHGDKGEGGVGPALSGVTAKAKRTDADLNKILTDSARQYGLKDPMPASFPGLTAGDRSAIIAWLHSLK
ncbi:MAG TPA: cytochrome b N-terminal domain-containing protein [Blastocatellia bacterium]|nr:cytochrome b N-terminal domain-containing protein [Blastocatellia bacterium]